jgi:diamine N-acetyltransferase
MLENETHRLRAMEPEDADWLFDIENDSKDWWMGATLNPIGRGALRNFASGQHDLWRDLQLRLMIETREDNPQTVGAVDLYQLDPRNRRAGVGDCHFGSRTTKRPCLPEPTTADPICF